MNAGNADAVHPYDATPFKRTTDDVGPNPNLRGGVDGTHPSESSGRQMTLYLPLTVENDCAIADSMFAASPGMTSNLGREGA